VATSATTALALPASKAERGGRVRCPLVASFDACALFDSAPAAPHAMGAHAELGLTFDDEARPVHHRRRILAQKPANRRRD